MFCPPKPCVFGECFLCLSPVIIPIGEVVERAVMITLSLLCPSVRKTCPCKHKVFSKAGLVLVARSCVTFESLLRHLRCNVFLVHTVQHNCISTIDDHYTSTPRKPCQIIIFGHRQFSNDTFSVCNYMVSSWSVLLFLHLLRRILFADFFFTIICIFHHLYVLIFFLLDYFFCNNFHVVAKIDLVVSSFSFR